MQAAGCPVCEFRPDTRTNRPSAAADARTDPTARRPPRFGCGPRAQAPPRSPPAGGRSARPPSRGNSTGSRARTDVLRGVRASIVKPGDVEAGHDQPDTPLAEAPHRRAVPRSASSTPMPCLSAKNRGVWTTRCGSTESSRDRALDRRMTPAVMSQRPLPGPAPPPVGAFRTQARRRKCQGRSKIRPPWRRKTRPLGSWVEWRNAAVRRGRQDAGVAAGWRAFLLCSRR